MSHIAEAYKVGLPVDLARTGITSDVLDVVLRVIRSPALNSGNHRLLTWIFRKNNVIGNFVELFPAKCTLFHTP